jgi:hypothetical protein
MSFTTKSNSAIADYELLDWVYITPTKQNVPLLFPSYQLTRYSLAAAFCNRVGDLSVIWASKCPQPSPEIFLKDIGAPHQKGRAFNCKAP